MTMNIIVVVNLNQLQQQFFSPADLIKVNGFGSEMKFDVQYCMKSQVYSTVDHLH